MACVRPDLQDRHHICLRRNKLVQRIIPDARNNVPRDRNSVALYKTN
jgi:hypothetical protein